MKLYRPVGTEELKLIEESGYKKFPVMITMVLFIRVVMMGRKNRSLV